jgi:hypothetical protein
MSKVKTIQLENDITIVVIYGATTIVLYYDDEEVKEFNTEKELKFFIYKHYGVTLC